MLTRIYGTAFFSQAELDEHLERLEAGAARDHRRLGPELGLFMLRPESPGDAVLAARGHGAAAPDRGRGARAARRGAATSEIKTPQVLDEELWHRSGHWDNYRENMFFTEPERARRRRAPLRAEADELPRRLPRLRLRAPLLPRPAAAPGRVRPRLALRARGRAPRPAAGARLHPGRRPRLLHARSGHRRGRRRSARRSTSSTRGSASTTSGSSSRPGRRSRSAPTSSGSGPRRALREALERQGREYDVSPGEGTFYGPKIDFHVTDALGRSWQCGTCQLDFQMPERFDLTYRAPTTPSTGR